MPITVFTASHQPIELDSRPLAAAGGEGSVHNIISPSSYANSCAKVYHVLKRTSPKKKKVEFMVQNRPSNLSGSHYIVCWPSEVIYNTSGDFVGYIMPLAFPNSEKLYELSTIRLPKKLNSNWSKFDRTTQLGIENRLKICFNIIIAVYNIHQTGKFAIVDYKPQNILTTHDGKISVLDVDSFQISSTGNTIHYAEVATPEYAPPESANLIPSAFYIPETWDRFSLAVSIYEILMGIHPYAATADGQYSNVTTISEKIKYGLFVHGSKKGYLGVVPAPHGYFSSLPTSIRTLFTKAFESGNANPTDRPSAEVWGGIIRDELQVKTGIKANTMSR